MRIQASVGREKKKDLRNHCHNLRLVAQTEEEAKWLARLYQLIMKEEGNLPCLPDQHIWTTEPATDPATEETVDVEYCRTCGKEKVS